MSGADTGRAIRSLRLGPLELMNKTARELTAMDATDQARLVARRQAAPTELVDAAIARIETANPSLNALIHTDYERARADATRPLPPGPFRGVPLVLKDIGCRSAGDPYHAGTRYLRRRDWRAGHDSVLATRFRAAGFVLVGRSNTPELAMSMTTEPLAYGPTHNPWRRGYSPGGSSGGSAAAVAARMVPVGHGNDGGGSIRIPASACGLVGLKPSRGRVSQAPDTGNAWAGFLVDHALTRSVRDTASVLDAIAGYAPGDPYLAVPPDRPFASEVDVAPGRLRVGILTHPPLPGAAADRACAAAVRTTATLLERLGHHVDENHPEALRSSDFDLHFLRVVSACCAADVEELARVDAGSSPDNELESGTLTLARLGRSLNAADYLTSIAWLQGYAHRVSAWWESDGFDLLVTPVLNGPTPPLGWLMDPERSGERVAQLLQYTRQFNVTGQPAVALPMHRTADGLPMGVQLIAGYGREDVLIRVSSQLERAQPWAHLCPPICVGDDARGVLP